MPSTYTSSNRFEKPGLLEQDGTWGTALNTDWDLVDKALSGVATIAMPDANYTLTVVSGAADEARCMELIFTGTLTATRTVTAPAGVTKIYVIQNQTNQTLNLTTSAGAPLPIAAGLTGLVATGVGGNTYYLIASSSTNATTLNGQAASYYLNASNLASGTVPNARLPTSSTSVPGIVQITDATNSTSITTAASPNSVKTSFDLATTANTAAGTAQTSANSAQSTANTAQTTANTAQATANNGVANAAAAQSTANTAATNAAAAQSTATTANNTANTAVTNAATAQSTANTAVTNAATAQSTANTAVTNAATAQSTANTAVTNAATAQSTANGKANPSTGTAGSNLRDASTGTTFKCGFAAANTTTITFPTAFPTACVSLVMVPSGFSAFPAVISLSAASATIDQNYGNGTKIACYWMAMGY